MGESIKSSNSLEHWNRNKNKPKIPVPTCSGTFRELFQKYGTSYTLMFLAFQGHCKYTGTRNSQEQLGTVSGTSTKLSITIRKKMEVNYKGCVITTWWDNECFGYFYQIEGEFIRTSIDFYENQDEALKDAKNKIDEEIQYWESIGDVES